MDHGKFLVFNQSLEKNRAWTQNILKTYVKVDKLAKPLEENKKLLKEIWESIKTIAKRIKKDNFEGAFPVCLFQC